MSKHNRRYKDSVFVDLFSEDEKAKENFLALYNALHGTNLPLSCPVENIRLDNVMYMSIINDISCLVDNKIIVLGLRVRIANSLLRGTTAVLSGSENVRPCTFLGYEFASELTTAWNQRHPCRF